MIGPEQCVRYNRMYVISAVIAALVDFSGRNLRDSQHFSRSNTAPCFCFMWIRMPQRFFVLQGAEATPRIVETDIFSSNKAVFLKYGFSPDVRLLTSLQKTPILLKFLASTTINPISHPTFLTPINAPLQEKLCPFKFRTWFISQNTTRILTKKIIASRDTF